MTLKTGLWVTQSHRIRLWLPVKIP